ncbi:hypothetical protein NQ318_014306 [Aromia moschata]|uniref:Uncharacterized protein n=1 Tax=Aromia moschata TaxID=1265417 RepID=A0AAV8YXZ6_9CUCU|nr:hypothetical protein NQ318_014306 [Aromia moschata]
MCIPSDEYGRDVLKIIDDLQLQNHNSLIVLMEVSTLPQWIYFFDNPTDKWDANNTNVSDNTTFATKKNVLIFANTDTVHLDLESYVVESVKKTVFALKTGSELGFGFTLGDFRYNDSLRPLLFVRGNGSTGFSVEKAAEDLEEWSLKHKQLDECDDCRSDLEKSLSVLVILGCSCLFVCVILAAAALARNQLVKKRGVEGHLQGAADRDGFRLPPDRRQS